MPCTILPQYAKRVIRQTTVKHILLGCSGWREQRRDNIKLFVLCRSVRGNIKKLLGTEEHDLEVTSYLKAINMFHKIVIMWVTEDCNYPNCCESAKMCFGSCYWLIRSVFPRTNLWIVDNYAAKSTGPLSFATLKSFQLWHSLKFMRNSCNLSLFCY